MRVSMSIQGATETHCQRAFRKHRHSHQKNQRMAEDLSVTAEEREIIRQLRSGELTYSPENFTDPNVIRRPFPAVVPAEPPPAPKQKT